MQSRIPPSGSALDSFHSVHTPAAAQPPLSRGELLSSICFIRGTRGFNHCCMKLPPCVPICRGEMNYTLNTYYSIHSKHLRLYPLLHETTPLCSPFQGEMNWRLSTRYFPFCTHPGCYAATPLQRGIIEQYLLYTLHEGV